MSKKPLVILAVIIVLAIASYLIISDHSKKTQLKVVSSSTNSTKLSSPAVVNNSVVVTKDNSKFGSYLSDPQGKTLYTYSTDSKDVSNCHGYCLAIWPAYQDKGSTSNLPSGIGTIRRNNGQIQYTFNGHPLYFYAYDLKPGQINGNGITGFYVARP
jgi:predicted lipoprotein with Yx(FWY)xxD motif